MDCFLFFMTCKNGKNRNQWKIISDQLFFQQLILSCFNLGRRRIQSSIFKSRIQNKKMSFEKVSRTCTIILFWKPAKMKKNVMVGFLRKRTFRNRTTDSEKGLILAWINLSLAVYFSIFAIGFWLFIFNCYFVYKWATKS